MILGRFRESHHGVDRKPLPSADNGLTSLHDVSALPDKLLLRVGCGARRRVPAHGSDLHTGADCMTMPGFRPPIGACAPFNPSARPLPSGFVSEPVAMLIAYLGVSPRFARRLAEAGVAHPADFTDWQPWDLHAVRQLGAAGGAEVTAALERRLGMTCGHAWTPPPAALCDPQQLGAALAADGPEATAQRLGVHVDAVTTWAAMHNHVPDPDTPPRERRPRSGGRAKAILAAGIPVSPARRRLLTVRAEHPDWTARMVAQELGWTRVQVETAWQRAMHEHPPEAVEEYVRRRRT